MFFYAMNNSTLTLSFTDLDSIFSGYGSRSDVQNVPDTYLDLHI
jgi:hypothetical protein